MRLFSKTTVIFALAIMLGGLVFHTSQKVQNLESDLRSIDAKIERERETTEVLEAEWEYLNRPQRLEELAKKRLEMEAPKNKAIVEDLNDVPELGVDDGGAMVVPSYKPAALRSGGEL